MHGARTDAADVSRLRDALESDTDAEPFDMVLYTSSGRFSVFSRILNLGVSVESSGVYI